jgi:hypothetical protein
MQSRSGARESARLDQPSSKLRLSGPARINTLPLLLASVPFCQPARAHVAHPTSFQILTLCSSTTAAAGVRSALRAHTAARLSSHGLTPHQRPMTAPPLVPLPSCIFSEVQEKSAGVCNDFTPDILIINTRRTHHPPRKPQSRRTPYVHFRPCHDIPGPL